MLKKDHALQSKRLKRIVIDEAHCCSQCEHRVLNPSQKLSVMLSAMQVKIFVYWLSLVPFPTGLGELQASGQHAIANAPHVCQITRNTSFAKKNAVI